MFNFVKYLFTYKTTNVLRFINNTQFIADIVVKTNSSTYTSFECTCSPLNNAIISVNRQDFGNVIATVTIKYSNDSTIEYKFEVKNIDCEYICELYETYVIFNNTKIGTFNNIIYNKLYDPIIEPIIASIYDPSSTELSLNDPSSTEPLNELHSNKPLNNQSSDELLLSEPSLNEPLLSEPSLNEPLLSEPLNESHSNKLLNDQPFEELLLYEPSLNEPSSNKPLNEQPSDELSNEQPLLSEPSLNEPLLSELLNKSPVEPLNESPVELLLPKPSLNEPLLVEPFLTKPSLIEPMLSEPVLYEPLLTEPYINKQFPALYNSIIESANEQVNNLDFEPTNESYIEQSGNLIIKQSVIESLIKKVTINKKKHKGDKTNHTKKCYTPQSID